MFYLWLSLVSAGAGVALAMWANQPTDCPFAKNQVDEERRIANQESKLVWDAIAELRENIHGLQYEKSGELLPTNQP